MVDRAAGERRRLAMGVGDGKPKAVPNGDLEGRVCAMPDEDRIKVIQSLIADGDKNRIEYEKLIMSVKVLLYGAIGWLNIQTFQQKNILPYVSLIIVAFLLSFILSYALIQIIITYEKKKILLLQFGKNINYADFSKTYMSVANEKPNMFGRLLEFGSCLKPSGQLIYLRDLSRHSTFGFTAGFMLFLDITMACTYAYLLLR